MKDRKIGEIFQHPTEGRLKVVAEPAYNECCTCVFNGSKRCTNDPDKIHTGRCAAAERADKTGVIFLRHKEEGGADA